MKRWIAPSILALFVVGMLIYGINFYQQEQIEQAKEPIRGEIIVYTDSVSYTHLRAHET